MKILKRVLIVLGSLIILFVIAFGVYLFLNIQDIAEAFEVGSPDSGRKILIATQGSEYKNLMVDTLTARLKGEDVYISVIDVSGLKEINEKDWDAEVIIHTTEAWKLPDPVKEYLGRIKNLDEVILLITSGGGEWKPEDCKVDVFTSASKVADIPELANRIEDKVNSLLGD
ncbi:hypothetical protein JW879_06435 [candidate division WOR-3 bacterium]|nr:hypothetical protein [candidate division WOR-3 bacterium]